MYAYNISGGVANISYRIGLVAKPDGGLRLITNCSAPEGNSVNSYIEEQFCKVKYSSLDQILDKIYDAGHRSKLIYIKSA